MKTRNLSKLIETKEFQELIQKFPVTYFIKDGNLLLKNSYIYIYIYSYMSEDIPYFQIFDIDRKMYCFDLNRIIADTLEDSGIYLKIFDYYKNSHTISIINEEIPGEIIMESYFFTKIEILKKYFPDLLNGTIEKYEKYFEPMIRGYQEMFDELKTFVV